MKDQDFNTLIDETLKSLENQDFGSKIKDGEVVNLIALKCPEPLMMLRQAFRFAAEGAFFVVFATDPSTERDIAGYCRFSGHKLHYFQTVSAAMAEYKKLFVFVLEKRQPQ